MGLSWTLNYGRYLKDSPCRSKKLGVEDTFKLLRRRGQRTSESFQLPYLFGGDGAVADCFEVVPKLVLPYLAHTIPASRRAASLML